MVMTEPLPTTTVKTETDRSLDRVFGRKKVGGIRDTRGYTAFRVANVVVIIVLCFVTLYPFLNVIAVAFSSQGYINAGRVSIIPLGFNVTTFGTVMSDPMFWRNYGNTVLYTTVATAISMVLTTMFAYALSKKRLKGRPFFVGLAVFTMFFSGGIIPNYVLINSLGWRNTLWALVIPNAISIFNLLVMKAFFENFPEELEEAASIDGASRIGFFWRILLPLSMPGLVTVGVLAFIGSWNGYLLPLLVISTGTLPQDLWPLPLGVTQFSTQYSQDTAAVLAYTALAMIPALAFFLIAEKRIVGGLQGAVKG